MLRFVRSLRPLSLLAFMFVIFGCAMIATVSFDERYGKPEVQDRSLPTLAAAEGGALGLTEYYSDVKGILDKRCVVCHGCYDAPCQLKMTSFEGIDRGANKDLVYNGTRLIADEPTRMFIDAQNTSQWREKNFYPVLNERRQTAEVNLNAGLVYQMLKLKKDYPLPEARLVPEEITLSIDREQSCPTIEEFDDYRSSHPMWGMPYGLPGLDDEQFRTLESWLMTGAKAAQRPPLSPKFLDELDKWERYLNGSSLKQQLVSRYIFEHLILANLYFPHIDTPIPGEREFFRLIRSASPPGEAIEPITTRRPFDDPGVARVYYRFQRVKSTIIDKTHMPYGLDDARMARWNELFYETDYQVSEWPGYEPKVAANPFDAFEQLPVKSRYKFMLDEAHFTISGFIKGPVCRGQVALNVIRDHFWVVFLDPDNEYMKATADFLSQEKDYLRMPAEDGSNSFSLGNWLKYSSRQEEYNKTRAEFLKGLVTDRSQLNVDLLWDGENKNPNAALTVYRHFDNATVIFGHSGQEPKTVWLIGYSLLERIHYLLVAGFDVYGNLGHQLNTRLYMDFLRMEAESNFLALLPPTAAQSELEEWNKGAFDEVHDYLKVIQIWPSVDEADTASAHEAKSQLLTNVHAHLGPKMTGLDPVNRPVNAAASQNENALRDIAKLKGAFLRVLPEQALLRVENPSGQDEIYTILNNVSHSNVSNLFLEDERIIPEEQYLSVVPGIVGSYPNVLLSVQASALPSFSELLAIVSNEEDYREFLDRFAIRRTNPDFWAFSDWLNAWYRDHSPVRAGYLDYNRLENR